MTASDQVFTAHMLKRWLAPTKLRSEASTARILDQAVPAQSKHWRWVATGICLAGLPAFLLQTTPVFAESDSWLQGPGELKGLSLEELMNQQVVSVSRQSERLSDAPTAISVITQEDIRRSGATSLPEALRMAPNLQVAQVNSHEWAISSRGFNNATANKLLVMIDGRTVYTPLFAGVFWDVQDVLLEDVDRIEVISGPGGTLWGANAVNGVINVISKSAQETQGALLLAGGGSELNAFGGVRYGGKLAENVFYRVYGKYTDRDSTLFANGNQATNAWYLGQGGFRLDWNAPGQNVVTFQGDYYDGGVAQPQAAHTALSGGNVISRWTHTFSEDSDIRVQMYYDHTHRRITHVFTEDLDTYDLDAQHRFALGPRNEVVWGLGYRSTWDDVENTDTLAFFPARLNRQVFSGFVQDRIAVVEDRLHLTLGSKMEHNDYTGWEVQPSARLAWNVTTAHMLWAAISRAVRTPSRVDRSFYVPGIPPFGILQGGADFDSEELVAYELGYRVQPAERLTLSLTGFYHDYDDLRSTEPISPPQPFPVIVGNGLRGETYGAEFAADYKITDWWRLRAGYTELQVHIRAKSGSLDMSRGSGESNDANHHFMFTSMWDLPAHFELDAGFRYVSHIANLDVPEYAELEARLGWEPRPNLELAVVGQNLLHPNHPEFGRPATRNEIERGVYGKITWRF